jgi:hypothetical protein
MPRIKTLIERPGGVIEGVDLRRLNTFPFFMLPNPPGNIIVAAANQSSAPQVMTVSLEGPALIKALMAQRTNVCRINLQIQDGQQMRGLQNGAIHIDAIFGSGAQPYRLPEDLYVDENRHLVISVTDISGAGTAVRPVALAERFTTQLIDPKSQRLQKRIDKRQYISMPYFYTLDNGSVTVAGGATSLQTVTIGQDQHFCLSQLSGVFTSRLMDINIFDVTKGESIIDGFSGVNFPISVNLIVGSNNFPFRFHEPIFFEAGTKLQVTLVDRSGAPNTVSLAFGGSAPATRM